MTRWAAIVSATLLVALWISLVAGPGDVSHGDVASVLLGREVTALQRALVWDLRLPRSLLAVCVGASLGLAGALTQGLFRNPLAEPGVLGVSAGAAMAGAVGLAIGLDAAGPWAIPGAACLGAIGVLLVLMAWARTDARTSTLILCGVALASVCGAVTTLVLSVGIERWEVGMKVVRWLMGSFDGRTWPHLAIGASALALGAALAAWVRQDLDALQLGSDTAVSLGVDLRHTWRVGITTVGLLAGLCTALTGVIGFVGLVVPHIARAFVGTGHARLLPASALLGGTLLLLVDVATRTIAFIALPPGVITSLLGTPVFLVVLARMRTEIT
ncbi:MAG: FecCD family ABC transporter permease [Nannocystaceae bacterium]|nr:iron ABC transporter permease [bacterium]